MTRDKIYYLGASILAVPALLMLMSAAVLLCGGSLAPWMFPAAIAASVAILIYYTRSWRLVATLGVFYAVTLLLASWLLDFSYDGIGYHQETTDAIMAGWNPYRQLTVPDGFDSHTPWCLNYAKVLEIARGMVATTFGYVEIGKVVNFYLWAASTLLAYCAIALTVGGRRSRLWLTAIAALNPVVVAQMPTYYVDFSLYCYWLSSLSLIVLIMARRHTRSAWMMLLAVTLLAIGTKFNIFFFQGYLLICWVIWLLWRGDRPMAYKAASLGLGALALGVLIIYYHPYVTNLIDKGNPLFPIFGEGSQDVMTRVTPELMLRVNNRVLNFIISVFTPAIPKYDCRIGGFGPCMGLMLVLSVAMVVKYRRQIPAGALYALGCIAVSVFILKETWWARFTPQLWLIPLIVMVYVGPCLMRRITSWLMAATFASLVVTLLYSAVYSYHCHWIYDKLDGTAIRTTTVMPHFARKMQHYGIRAVEAAEIDSARTVKMDVPGEYEYLRHVEVEPAAAWRIDEAQKKESPLVRRLSHPAKFGLSD